MLEKNPYSSLLGGSWRAWRISLPLLLLLSALSLGQLTTALLESHGTLPALTWAARLSPLDHHPRLLLADLEPYRAPLHWNYIRSLHPSYAPAWIRLGLDLERQGQFTRAQQAFAHAAQLDRTFLPQWTLANFHYRRGDAAQFWRYARTAAAPYQGDLTGVFSLCLRLDPDPLAVWNRLQPSYPAARLDLLGLLLRRQRLADAARLAPHAAAVPVRGTAGMLLAGCQSASDAGDNASAVAFWNAAAAHRWIARPPLNPAQGVLIADPAFHHQPTHACFDWDLPAQNGVLAHAGLPAGLRLEFSGLQPPGAVAARLRLPVLPATRYRLVWRYGVEFTPNSAPPVWRIAGQQTAPWPPALQGREESFEFSSGAATLLDLELLLPPAMGRTRPEGKLRLEWVRVEPVLST